jgi:hypothetical protein
MTFDRLAATQSVPSVLPSSAMIISYDLESELNARSTSRTHFSICKASLWAGRRTEISVFGLATLKAVQLFPI